MQTFWQEISVGKKLKKNYACLGTYHRKKQSRWTLGLTFHVIQNARFCILSQKVYFHSKIAFILGLLFLYFFELVEMVFELKKMKEKKNMGS